ncbi:alpha/beta hydrolase [Actinomadura miaoliensis]|uniref:Alpha/beta hydrolase n=1 Tax=Actinomadura miaoliensis TaxID=430685 RepID=A0ABP7UWJ7_9ACTN
MTWSERVVVRDGVRLFCRDWGGTGPPLLLLHGLAGHAGEWDLLAQRLTPRYRVVAVDQRGHGAAERRPQDVSRAAYVADAIAVVDQLALHKPVLVGQSLGGHTAMLVAAARLELPRALVLIEAGPGDPTPNAPADIGAWLDSWPIPFPSRASAAEFFGGGPVGEAWAAGLEKRDTGWWPRFDRDVMVDSLAETARRSFWHEWSQISCPTLLILAEASFLPAQEAEQMLRIRPATVAMSIPHTGHDLHLQRPDTLHTVLLEFLNGLPPHQPAGSTSPTATRRY